MVLTILLIKTLNNMKEIKVNGNLGEFTLNLPESISEISNEYLDECTKHIHPAPYYALIGIVYKDALTTVLTAAKKNKPANLAIVPIFIKCGRNTDLDFIKDLHLGDTVVVASSDISIGNHINSPYNKITPQNIIEACDGDKDIYKDAMLMQKPICMLEFKLIPVGAIHGKLDKTHNVFRNPYIYKTLESKGEA